MGFESVVQSALWQRLSSEPSLSAIPIYDDVPQAIDAGNPDAFPFIVIGEDTTLAWDTDTENGASVTVTIHTWSRYAGKKEIKALQGFIYSALHNTALQLAAPYIAVLCSFQQSQSFLDADGVTRHGVQTFHLLIDQ